MQRSRSPPRKRRRRCTSCGGTREGEGAAVPWGLAQTLLAMADVHLCGRFRACCRRRDEDGASNSRPPDFFPQGWRDTLRAHFDKDSMDFWTVLHQLVEVLGKTDWKKVRDHKALVDEVYARCRPLECDVPEPAFVQMLLLKMWPECPSAEKHHLPSALHEWSTVKAVVGEVERRLTAQTGFPIRFDEKHLHHLRLWHETEKTLFWSVFDQLQDALVGADWGKVCGTVTGGGYTSGRFIQAILNSCSGTRAEEYPLSSFLSESPALRAASSTRLDGVPPHLASSVF
eukprot:TRINITY_DN18738_c0_g1_i1.p1 TRINITY_DN18738_c0_g1~~TRINITY_DN18738_c0_g1_i1.p1  ORF type:complete len:293 (+),score=78.43 TRINITY_DN18738_c0_g1_i1:23-880(+)